MVKRSLFLGLLVGLIVVLPGCWPLGTAKKTGLVIVNVLDADLHGDCHIKGSINIPVESIDTAVDLIDKDAEVVVYCSNYMCTSSGFAQARLKELGFKMVYAYEAGMAEWYSKGLPVEGNCEQGYLKHPMQPSVAQEAGGVITTEKLADKMGMHMDDAN